MPGWDTLGAPVLDSLQLGRGRARVLRGLGLRAPVRETAGRYELEHVIGSGGFGRVYRGFDPRLARAVAVKAISVAAANSEALLAAARSEARVLAAVSHRGIVEVFDVFTRRSADQEIRDLMIVMELVEGQTLDVWVKKRRPSHCRILATFREAGEALAAAHRVGVVHCDFKPTNAIRRPDGRVAVLDFGVAGLLRRAQGSAPGTATGGDDSMTMPAGRIVGTPAYMAPEQHRGEPPTPAWDVYALGVALYEALHDRRPFEGTSPPVLELAKGRQIPRHLDAAVPRWLHKVILRALAPDPDNRFPSMDAFVAALGEPRRSRRGLALACGVVAVGAVGVLAPPSQESACAGGDLTQAWAERRPRLEALWNAHLEPQRSAAFVAAVDDFVDRWSRSRRDACAEPIDARRRLGCLDAAARTATAGLDLPLEAGTADLVDLPDLAECNDEELLRRDPLPEDPRARAEALDLVHLASTGELAALPRDEIEAHIERARRLGHRPTLAAVLFAVGDRAWLANDLPGMTPYMEEVYPLAAQSGADRLALNAAVRLVLSAEDLDTSRRWAGTTLALAERLPGADQQRAMAQAYLAFKVYNLGHVERAWAEIEPALTWATEAPDHEGFALVVLVRALHFAVDSGHVDRARAYVDEVERRLPRAQWRSAFLRFDAAVQLALVARRSGDFETARRHLRGLAADPAAEAGTRWVATLGLSEVAVEAGDPQEALRILDESDPHASAIIGRNGEPEDHALALAERELARVEPLVRLCRLEEARRGVRAALHAFERILPREHIRFRQLQDAERRVEEAACGR